MASYRDIQAGRDAADFDNDRKDGRYAAGGDRAAWFDRDINHWTPSVAQSAALNEALAQIDRVFPRAAA